MTIEVLIKLKFSILVNCPKTAAAELSLLLRIINRNGIRSFFGETKNFLPRSILKNFEADGFFSKSHIYLKINRRNI